MLPARSQAKKTCFRVGLVLNMRRVFAVRCSSHYLSIYSQVFWWDKHPFISQCPWLTCIVLSRVSKSTRWLPCVYFLIVLGIQKKLCQGLGSEKCALASQLADHALAPSRDWQASCAGKETLWNRCICKYQRKLKDAIFWSINTCIFAWATGNLSFMGTIPCHRHSLSLSSLEALVFNEQPPAEGVGAVIERWRPEGRFSRQTVDRYDWSR